MQAGFDIEEVERFGFSAQRFEPLIPHILGIARWQHGRIAMTRKVEHEHLPLGISPSKRVDGWQPHAVVERQPMEQDERRAVVGKALQKPAESCCSEGPTLGSRGRVVRSRGHAADPVS